MNSWSSRELEEASSSPLAMICVNSSGRGYQWGTTSRPINGQNKFHLPHHAGHKSVDVTSSSFVCGHPHRTVPYMFKRRGSIRVEVEVSVHWKTQIIRNLCLEIGVRFDLLAYPLHMYGQCCMTWDFISMLIFTTRGQTSQEMQDHLKFDLHFTVVLCHKVFQKTF